MAMTIGRWVMFMPMPCSQNTRTLFIPAISKVATDMAHLTAHVNETAFNLFCDHAARAKLGHKIGRFDVEVEDRVKVLLLCLPHRLRAICARVVKQDVKGRALQKEAVNGI